MKSSKPDAGTVTCDTEYGSCCATAGKKCVFEYSAQFGIFWYATHAIHDPRCLRIERASKSPALKKCRYCENPAHHRGRDCCEELTNPGTYARIPGDKRI